MKMLWQMSLPFIKAVLGVVTFLIGIGWGAFATIQLIVRAEGDEIRREVMEIRSIDKDYIGQRFDRIEKRFEEVIQEVRKK